MSISDFHPEGWSPAWPVNKIIIGLISFMLQEDKAVGTIECSAEKREQIADESKEAVMSHPTYKYFRPYAYNIGLVDHISEENEDQRLLTATEADNEWCNRVQNEPINEWCTWEVWVTILVSIVLIAVTVAIVVKTG